MVVSNIFYFHPYLGKIPILNNTFQMNWLKPPTRSEQTPPFCGWVWSASFHWPNCWACDKVVKILNRQNGQTNSSWNLKFVKTHILGEFHHDVFPLLCLKRFFFWGTPREKQTFSSSPALGPVFYQARKVSQAFHQAEVRSENVGPAEEIWYEFFWEFLKRIIWSTSSTAQGGGGSSKIGNL